MRNVLMGLCVAGLFGCGGVDMSEEAAATQEAVTSEAAVIVRCTNSSQCAQYGAQYCGGDPGMCYRGSCLCP